MRHRLASKIVVGLSSRLGWRRWKWSSVQRAHKRIGLETPLRNDCFGGDLCRFPNWCRL